LGALFDATVSIFLVCVKVHCVDLPDAGFPLAVFFVDSLFSSHEKMTWDSQYNWLPDPEIGVQKP